MFLVPEFRLRLKFPAFSIYQIRFFSFFLEGVGSKTTGFCCTVPSLLIILQTKRSALVYSTANWRIQSDCCSNDDEDHLGCKWLLLLLQGRWSLYSEKTISNEGKRNHCVRCFSSFLTSSLSTAVYLSPSFSLSPSLHHVQPLFFHVFFFNFVLHIPYLEINCSIQN